jgi:hypothetical protein
MRRREFITLLGGAAALPSFVALAQVPTKRPLIALLLASSKTATQERRSGFRLGMQETHTWEGREQGKELRQKLRCAEGFRLGLRDRGARVISGLSIQLSGRQETQMPAYHS